MSTKNDEVKGVWEDVRSLGVSLLFSHKMLFIINILLNTHALNLNS